MHEQNNFSIDTMCLVGVLGAPQLFDLWLVVYPRLAFSNPLRTAIASAVTELGNAGVATDAVAVASHLEALGTQSEVIEELYKLLECFVSEEASRKHITSHMR